MKKINKILIIRPDAIGDFINITPVLCAIKNNAPNIKITLLGSEANAPIARIHPLIDEVIIDKTKSGLLKFAGELRGKNFDAALIYYNELNYALLTLLAGIPVRVGDKDKVLLSLIYNCGTHINNADQTKHVMEYNLQYLQAIGFKVNDCKLNLPPSPVDFPIFGKPLIGILLGYVGGTAARRTLSKEFYAETTKKIIELIPPATIVLLGNKDMAEDAKYIANQWNLRLNASVPLSEPRGSLAGSDKQVIDLVGKTSLYELMSVISKLNVYIGVDTGPTHIAAAYGISMVFINAIKSPKPQRWAPLYSPKVIVKFKEKCPDICNYAACKKTICSDSISTDEIAEGVKHLLEPPRQTGAGSEFLNSFYKSNNIVFIADKLPSIAKDLEKKGLNVSLFPKNKFNILNLKNILDALTYEDATIIHSTVNKPFIFKLLSLISPSRLLTPPLIIYSDKVWGSADELVKYYIERFREKTHV
ncbi:MAG: glycosyltransferase family 9 protein [Candidatus Margulisiibacteriota bacterium]